LLSYFSTMVTVLAVLMVLLNGVLGASTFRPARAQAHLRVAYTQTIAPGNGSAAAPKPQQVAQISPVTHQASATPIRPMADSGGRLRSEQPRRPSNKGPSRFASRAINGVRNALPSADKIRSTPQRWATRRSPASNWPQLGSLARSGRTVSRLAAKIKTRARVRRASSRVKFKTSVELAIDDDVDVYARRMSVNAWAAFVAILIAIADDH